MNTVQVIGNLAQDPEVRFTKNGKARATFSVAVTRSFNSFAGQEAREFTDFIPIVAWGNLAEKCGDMLAKGQRIFVEGRMSIRSYETPDGQKRRITEVVANFVAKSLESDQGSGGGSSSKTADFGSMGQDVSEDDIPF